MSINAINNQPLTQLPIQTHSVIKNASFFPIAEKISPLAKRTLMELGVAFALNVGVISFFATPLGFPLTIVWLQKALISSMVATVPKMAWEIYTSQKTQDDKFLEGSSHLAKISIANSIGLSGPQHVIHEYLGHATAAKLLFENPRVKVRIFPYRAGSTTYTISRLTKLGALLGKEKAVLFVTAAGIMASTTFALFEFALANGIKDRFPTISEWLNYHGIVQIFNEVVYGLTGYLATRTDLTHDFIRLWTMGEVHPLIPIGLMIALPLLEVALLKILSLRNQSQKASKLHPL